MPEQAPLGEVVIPLAEETVTVSKREVETGRVQVALTTEVETVIARETLHGRWVEVERVPVARWVVGGTHQEALGKPLQFTPAPCAAWFRILRPAPRWAWLAMSRPRLVSAARWPPSGAPCFRGAFRM